MLRYPSRVGLLSAILALIPTSSAAANTARQNAPTVTLDNGTFIGTIDASTGSNAFLGIPFAQPPIGDLRFALPVPVDPYSGVINATAFGLSCPQQIGLTLQENLTADTIAFFTGTAPSPVIPESEDCLTINVWQPIGVATDAKLPVIALIYGGGFEIGASSTTDGGMFVGESLSLGEPVVFVSMNYRVTAFGFLAGKEIQEAGAGNMGIHDQRLSLQWIQKYVSAFGGDPTKVTLWGGSAGAFSIATHLVANDGNNEGLFRGAVMNSGAALSVSDLASGQKDYDFLVAQTRCQGTADTLQCLRQLPFDVLKAAVNTFPTQFSNQSLHLNWLPKVDGVFITDNLQKLVLEGKIANVPFVSTDVDDEGTAPTLALLNLLTDDEIKSYLSSNYFPSASQSDLDRILALYPQDVAQGSPFGTGDLNAVTAQFKRVSAIQGDLFFQGPRRFLLEQRSDKQPTWSYLSKKFKTAPVLGSLHGSDEAGNSTVQFDSLINFVNHLDPNGPTVPHWPRYTTASPQLLTIFDDPTPINITLDDFRTGGIALLQQLFLDNPF